MDERHGRRATGGHEPPRNDAWIAPEAVVRQRFADMPWQRDARRRRAPRSRANRAPVQPPVTLLGTWRSECAISSMDTSRNVSTFALLTKRAGRYMSHTQASPMDTS